MSIDNEFILQDRIQKIQQIVNKYGEENFCISYSGGKDSNVLSELFDLALPNNKILRVYCNTGIEYKLIADFVKEKAANDDRFHIITPNINIKTMLEEKGYPFKSKKHSSNYTVFKRNGIQCKTVQRYLQLDPSVPNYSPRYSCPKNLEYQFTENNGLNFYISDHCCEELKEKPLLKFQKDNNLPIAVIGITKAEGGRRAMTASCLSFANGKLKAFQPLIPITKEWEDWFIRTYNIKLPKLYYPPYNFDRTGCKGCPFNPKLQKELDVLQQYFPNERKQCEIIWKPVYEEYRKVGFRLNKNKKENV